MFDQVQHSIAKLKWVEKKRWNNTLKSELNSEYGIAHSKDLAQKPLWIQIQYSMWIWKTKKL